MTRCRITKEDVDAARKEYFRQLYAWEDQEDKDEDCCGIRVVIARNVTPGMVKRIPKRWLHGLAVTLSADGVLGLEDVEGREHNETKADVTRMLGNYVLPCRDVLDVSVGTERPDDYYGETLTPDCVLRAPHPATPTLSRSLVIAEIEVHHLGVRDIILKARKYLSELYVERVVVFKLFPARVSALHQHPALLHRAALAIVFERAGVHQPGTLAEIRVVDEVSFGTAPLDDNVLRNLSTVPSRTVPAGQIRPIAASPFESPHLAIQISNVHASFAAMSDITSSTPLRMTVDLNRANLAAPVVFDLCEVFKVAASGWNQDRLLRRLR